MLKKYITHTAHKTQKGDIYIMKKKSFEKKLSFNKSTVVDLEKNVMAYIKGRRGSTNLITCTLPDTYECSDDACISIRECPDSQWVQCTHQIC